MDRQDRPSSSRIPSAGALRTPSTRLATTTRTPLSSLGKRPAGEAGLSEDPTATRRALHTAQGRQTTLERKVAELERQLRQRDQNIEEQLLEISTLREGRTKFSDDEDKAKKELQRCEEEWKKEKTQFVEALNHYRRKSHEATSQLVELQSQYQSVAADHARLKHHSRQEISLLEGRVKEVEDERDALRGWQKRAEELAIELEEMRRKQEQGTEARDSLDAEKRATEIVRLEVQRQSNNIVQLQNANDSLQTEVTELRRWKKDADVRERAAKQTERELRNDAQSLNVELERARREINRLCSLSALHEEVKAQLSEQTKLNDQLHSRLTNLASDSEGAAYNLTRQLDDATRELRWAKEGRQNAEKREKLLKSELASFYGAGAGAGPAGAGADSAARVRQLEVLVETYKAEIEGMARDSRDAEERLAKGSGMVKASALAEAEEMIKGLESEIANLTETVTGLTTANASLNDEVAELMRRVWSGEFNPERERCLEFKANPAAKIHAVRTEQLENLKAENAALLARLAECDTEPSSSSSTDHGLVPRISYDRLHKEKTELEAAHEKRLRRLKEIFGAKSREFLESVYSLLGWRIKFDENGADIRLTSMYAPKGKMGLTLKFTSNEGHFGTMAMMGGMARSLEEARDFWVTERQSIPGFLAQVTAEMFEKTTLGRAAGYVGLE